MRIRSLLVAACALHALFLAGCGQRTVQLNFVPVDEKLRPETIEEDQGLFVWDKIALLNISGLIANAKGGPMFGSGHNKVSDFREALNEIERDPTIKAVVLRMNTPGGTVTASDIMYRDLLEFKRRTRKPVVVSMMDVCASGGFYISCAGDYRMAYPSTITGSIGVIIQTINVSGTLGKLGMSAEALTSGPNKDVGSPLRPMTANDRKILGGFVDQFYHQFSTIVKETHPKVNPQDWPMLTDGRIISGKDAARYGLVDQTGDLNDAIAKAKQLAGIQRAKVITYIRTGDATGSVYAKAPAEGTQPQVNMININLNVDELAANTHPQFLYLWMGQ